jgi:membrane associated rhomboid family serine protease
LGQRRETTSAIAPNLLSRSEANRSVLHRGAFSEKMNAGGSPRPDFPTTCSRDFMIPLRDNIPSRTTPVINYAIIAVCSVTFLLQVGQKDGGQTMAQQYGMVPARLTDPDAEPVMEVQVPVRTGRGITVENVRIEIAPAAVPPWMTLITCMFLHGGWMHFLGNMWFLYIFGDNVEDRLGHFGYLLTYLGTGVLASLAHYAASPGSPVPTIGASGAIAGVMGAYALLYPHARVLAVLPIFVFLQFFVLPAFVFLGIWFLIQTFSGLASPVESNVAWWAHIGGFVAGAIVALVVGRESWGHGPVEERRF